MYWNNQSSKVHSIANADAEFDFNESFWRYELSLGRRLRSSGLQSESSDDPLLEIPSVPLAIDQPTINASNSLAHIQNLLARRPSGTAIPHRVGHDGSMPGIEPFLFDDLTAIFAINSPGDRPSSSIAPMVYDL